MILLTCHELNEYNFFAIKNNADTFCHNCNSICEVEVDKIKLDKKHVSLLKQTKELNRFNLD